MRSGPPLLSAEQIKEKLTQFFSSEAHVLVAYLFGSNARREAGCLSDVDIAVLFDDSVTKREAFELQLRLIVDIGDLLKTNSIDLVVLNEAPLLLAFNIIRDGIILKSNEKRRVLFETEIMSSYFDREYYINRHTKRAIERMAESKLK